MIRSIGGLLIVGLLLALAPPAHSAGSLPENVSAGAFCEVSSAEYRAEEPVRCTFSSITLPHNWTPSTSGPSLGRYRFEIPRPRPGLYGVLLNRVPLDGEVRVDGRAVINRLDIDQTSRWRYWPVMGHFTVDEAPGDRLVIEITTRAHSEIKNGLGGIRVGPLPLIEAEYRDRLVADVLLLAGLAVAAIFAGVIGLTIGDQRNVTTRVLVVVSWLSIVGGLRCLHNLVIDAPLSVVVWQRIGLWLLALAGLLTLQVVSTYLAKDRPSRKPLLGGVAAITLLFAMPPALINSKIVINFIFAAIPLVALVLLGKLAWRLKTRSDAIGITILVIFAITLAAGIHDYVVPLGSATLSGQYLQTWTLPATLAISIVALVKRASDQREIETQLQQATVRREELLRDLHDRIGSRLVALSFHARQVSGDPALVGEIQSLIHEVRLIHGAVAAEATSIDSLLADLRHLYSRIGGGRRPIHWELAELAVPLALDANQAIAVLRIVEEAVANIIKHAQAERITIRLTGPYDNDLAALEVIDDGAGEFRPGESGGLENMRLRAEQVGLNIELTRLDQGKAVRIRFPRLSARR